MAAGVAHPGGQVAEPAQEVFARLRVRPGPAGRRRRGVERGAAEPGELLLARAAQFDVCLDSVPIGDGEPAAVLANPAVREVFLGTDVTAALAGGSLEPAPIEGSEA